MSGLRPDTPLLEPEDALDELDHAEDLAHRSVASIERGDASQSKEETAAADRAMHRARRVLCGLIAQRDIRRAAETPPTNEMGALAAAHFAAASASALTPPQGEGWRYVYGVVPGFVDAGVYGAARAGDRFWTGRVPTGGLLVLQAARDEAENAAQVFAADKPWTLLGYFEASPEGGEMPFRMTDEVRE